MFIYSTLMLSTGSRDDPSLNRTWFYFPSISTRAKRDDIVRYAPGYGLTGFLLAGKPGILCLEGPGHAVDEYMSFIKKRDSGINCKSVHDPSVDRRILPWGTNNKSSFVAEFDWNELQSILLSQS